MSCVRGMTCSMLIQENLEQLLMSKRLLWMVVDGPLENKIVQPYISYICFSCSSLLCHHYTIHANPRETKSGRVSRVCPPPSQKIVFQKDPKWCILMHLGYKICSVKSLNIVWKKHEKMEISILHIYKSKLGPSNSDG